MVQKEKFLDTFVPETIIYEAGELGGLCVKLVQARRVGRVRRQILYKEAVKSGIHPGRAMAHFLASRTEIPHSRGILYLFPTPDDTKNFSKTKFEPHR